MRTLEELKGVKVLSKTEQKTIAGGYQHCDSTHFCWPGWCCVGNTCLRCEVEP